MEQLSLLLAHKQLSLRFVLKVPSQALTGRIAPLNQPPDSLVSFAFATVRPLEANTPHRGVARSPSEIVLRSVLDKMSGTLFS